LGHNYKLSKLAAKRVANTVVERKNVFVKRAANTVVERKNTVMEIEEDRVYLTTSEHGRGEKEHRGN
jgi:hypothetical protein